MTPPVVPYSAFAGVVPANLSCGFCGRPVQKQFYRALNRFACSNCAGQVQAAIAKNAVTPASFISAAGVGLVVALAGGAVWAITVHVMHIYLGILAAFIGVGVGKTVLFASGKRRAVAMQWLSTILAVIGVGAGKIGLTCWQLVDAIRDNGGDASAANVFHVLQQNPKLLTDPPIDFLWIAIAAYAAWRLCKAPAIPMAGPYAYDPGRQSADDSLQFQTVEPLDDVPAPPPGQR